MTTACRRPEATFAVVWPAVLAGPADAYDVLTDRPRLQSRSASIAAARAAPSVCDRPVAHVAAEPP